MKAIKIFIFSAKNIYLILISSSNFIYTFPALAQQVAGTNSWITSATEKTACFDKNSNLSVTASNNFRLTDSTQMLLERAFIEKKSNIQVAGEGRVIKLLPDDLDGDRHQRFIVRLTSGQTLLIAHNISLAPRISLLQTGDLISFSGEYEWNPQGGIIHWTHRDPNGRHVGGWIKHGGKLYQ